jgi:pimeloyl-ACP methyl ester carboxylesterase
MICPGNGCSNIRQSNWYGALHNDLEKAGIQSICENFPDPYAARREIWIPHMRQLVQERCKDDPANVILVGHSSGAQAALRYAELYPCRACVLVSATYTDLGDASERASGYYPSVNAGAEVNSYLFELMNKHCPVWHQFHSDDDPFIPLHEAERIRDGLGLNEEHYHMLPGRSHFFEAFPELMQVVQSIVDEVK